MKAAGISGLAPRKRRRTTIRLPGARAALDLVGRDFRPTGPDQTWSADITYSSTWEGLPYLAHVRDLFSRRIVGWSMADHIRAELGHRRARDGARPTPPRSRTDSPLRSGLSERCCSRSAAPMPGSRSRWDRSATAMTTPSARPSTPSSKKEKIYRQSWPTRAEARTAIFATSKGGTTRGAGTPRSATCPRSSSSDSTPSSPNRRSKPRFRTTDRSRRPPRRAQIGSQRVASRPSASISQPKPRARLITLSSCQPTPLRPRQAPVKHERQPVASPTRSHRTSSLTQTPTTTAKDVSSKPGAVQRVVLHSLSNPHRSGARGERAHIYFTSAPRELGEQPGFHARQEPAAFVTHAMGGGRSRSVIRGRAPSRRVRGYAAVVVAPSDLARDRKGRAGVGEPAGFERVVVGVVGAPPPGR